MDYGITVSDRITYRIIRQAVKAETGTRTGTPRNTLRLNQYFDILSLLSTPTTRLSINIANIQDLEITVSVEVPSDALCRLRDPSFCF